MIILFISVCLLALGAYYKQSLTKSGMYAAIVVGCVISFSLSFFGLIVLGAFFISSSLIGKVVQGSGDTFELKGEKRDAAQVLANGGWAAVCALLYGLTDAAGWLFAFVATISAANSDTWASVAGRLSRSKPRHFLTFDRLEHGQSGGMTIIGTVGAMLGAIFISIIAWSFNLLFLTFEITVYFVVFTSLVGFVAQYIDTIIGGTFQVLYRCSVCGNVTEKGVHCYHPSVKIRGIHFFTNDVTNHVCTASAVLFSWLYISFI